MGHTSKWTKAEMLDSSRSLLSAERIRIFRSTHWWLDSLPTEVGCLFWRGLVLLFFSTNFSVSGSEPN